MANFWSIVGRDFPVLLQEAGQSVIFGTLNVTALVSQVEIAYDLERGGQHAQGAFSIKCRRSDFVTIPKIGDTAIYNGRRLRIQRIDSKAASPIIEFIATPMQ